MTIAKRQGEGPLLRRMFGLHLVSLTGTAQPIMPVFGTSKDFANPVAQRAEIGVGQPGATADEQQGMHAGERLLHGLGMRITQNAFIRPYTEHHRLRSLPKT